MHVEQFPTSQIRGGIVEVELWTFLDEPNHERDRSAPGFKLGHFRRVEAEGNCRDRIPQVIARQAEFRKDQDIKPLSFGFLHEMLADREVCVEVSESRSNLGNA